jgi:hypothetical protein
LLKQRKQIRKGFENVEKTKLYYERNYYNLVSSGADTIEANEFWVGWGEHILKGKGLRGHLSKDFYHLFCGKSTSLQALVLGLSVVDLQSGEYSTKIDSDRNLVVEVKKESVIVFWK